jgi:dTDP-4-dehydrorhamnose reductase
MILLTGGSGQLGQELQKLGDYYAPSRAELDVTDDRSVYQTLASTRPDLIVHAAAYTNTLGADRDTQEMQLCWRTNVLGTRNLVDRAECPIVYISTEAVVHPYSFYILTKLQGELEVQRSRWGYTIVRTSFREDPFEYGHAFTDMWTIGDTTSKIASMLHDLVQGSRAWNKTLWLGTGAKTVYQLARQTRPEVKPILRADLNPYLPSLEELVDVTCES